MEQFDNGATEAGLSRTGSAVPSGWRKPSLALDMAARHAEDGQGRAVEKTRAIVAVKRVGPHLGLKPADLLLLDTLGAFSQPQDWGQGQRAIVWPSNALLTERTGLSLSALKRHVRRLAETGLIAFQDSPNGKRWGRRDRSGQIVEAYGYDLTPLAARAEEFEALFQHLEAERDLRQRLRRQITVLRRTIRARLDCAAMAERFDTLLEAMPKAKAPPETLERFLAALLAFLQNMGAPVGKSLETEENPREMDPREGENGPHIQTTKKLKPVEKGPIDLGLLRYACPELPAWAEAMGARLRSPGDLRTLTAQIRPMLGISDKAWSVAQEKMGYPEAAASLALILEKSASGEIVSPNGYLRGMAKKAGAGELNLERSLYGRAQRNALAH